MGSGEIRKTYWQQRAEELFLGEYEQSERFYREFGEPTALYNELAKRAMGTEDEGMAVYRKMYTAYAADQTQNNHAKLDAMIDAYMGTITNVKGE
jgi:hypothetical protein